MRGFTLVELLVVLMFVFILGSWLDLALRDSNNRYAVLEQDGEGRTIAVHILTSSSRLEGGGFLSL